MRGNNPHFKCATVHHELISGHHLRGYMTDRFNSHRNLFNTPFGREGWALYLGDPAVGARFPARRRGPDRDAVRCTRDEGHLLTELPSGEAFVYLGRAHELLIRADTTLTIDLQADPAILDSMLVFGWRNHRQGQRPG